MMKLPTEFSAGVTLISSADICKKYALGLLVNGSTEVVNRFISVAL
jgi:hypothetical protein